MAKHPLKFFVISLAVVITATGLVVGGNMVSARGDNGNYDSQNYQAEDSKPHRHSKDYPDKNRSRGADKQERDHDPSKCNKHRHEHHHRGSSSNNTPRYNPDRAINHYNPDRRLNHYNPDQAVNHYDPDMPSDSYSPDVPSNQQHPDNTIPDKEAK